jgi:acetyl-CoA acetyltransferase
MLNLDREIAPDDFAIPRGEMYCSDDPVSVAMHRERMRQREELKRLYELQEEAKAKAHFKAEQARKEQIRFSEALAIAVPSGCWWGILDHHLQRTGNANNTHGDSVEERA